MRKQISDERIDQLLRKLVNDAALEDATVNEIADSPQLWWGVQRKIKTDEKPLSMWNVGFMRRWLMLGVPLTVAALLLIAFFALKPTENPIEEVTITPTQPSNETVILGSEEKLVENSTPEITAAKKVEIALKQTNSIKKAVVEKKGPRPQQLRSSQNVKFEQVEIKSEFIALSYARNPESGQIVRVKVPSSMMVSLGLVASVEKPTNLVNAELLVGDDGMTHAIRFIH